MESGPTQPVAPGAQTSSVLTPGTTLPGNIKASQIDNPPRTRVLSTGTAPTQTVLTPTLAGLGFVDLIYMRKALEAALTDANNPDQIESLKRMITMISDKLSPPSPIKGLGSAPLVPSIAAAQNTRPIVPPVKPKGS